MAKGRKTGGRIKGIPNKATAAAREAIANFVDGNAHRLEEWLEEIYESKGAESAFDRFTTLLEYHVPKLQRTELTGKDGGAITIMATPLDEAL